MLTGYCWPNEAVDFGSSTETDFAASRIARERLSRFRNPRSSELSEPTCKTCKSILQPPSCSLNATLSVYFTRFPTTMNDARRFRSFSHRIP